MLTNPKSAVGLKLQSLQLHAGNLVALEEMRSIIEDAKHHEGAEHFAWYGPMYSAAISAGVKALACLIDSDASDAYELLSEHRAARPANDTEAA